MIERVLVTELPAGGVGTLKNHIGDIYDSVPPEKRNLPIFIRLPVKYSRSRSIVQSILDGTDVDNAQQQARYEDVFEFAPDKKRGVLRRLRVSPIYLLYSDEFEYVISDNVNPLCSGVFDVNDADFVQSCIEAIKTTEIDELVKTGRCLYPPLPEGAYRAPSGRLVKSYIRVGNLQSSRNALDGLFFWMLPHLSDCIGIVSDTWTISSITQTISRRLSVYRDQISDPIPVEMLPRYHSKTEDFGAKAAELITQFFERLGVEDEGRVLVLLSATHTGSLHRHLEKPLSYRGLTDLDVNYLAIFKLRDESDMACLRDYSKNSLFEDVDESSVSSIVEIDGLNHVPVPEHCNEVIIKKKYFEPLVARLRPYEALPWLRLHYTDRMSQGEPRHHMIWVDIVPLIENETFLGRFFDKLDSLDPQPKLIIHPDLTGIKSLAEKAVRRLKAKGTIAIAIQHDNYDITNRGDPHNAVIAETLAGMADKDAVLFLDDAFVTGQRVHTYQLHARDDDHNGNYHYLAIVARPQSAREWTRAQLVFQHGSSGKGALSTFDCVEMILLPNWDETKCSWCAETGFHQEEAIGAKKSFRDLGQVVTRGLTENIFHIPQECGEFRLKSGSLFGPKDMNNVHLFMLIASSIQSLRAGDLEGVPKLGDDYTLIRTVLHHDNFKKYFTDSALISAFLRAARPRELMYPKHEMNVANLKFCEKRLADSPERDLQYELQLAKRQGKLIEKIEAELPTRSYEEQGDKLPSDSHLKLLDRVRHFFMG